MISTTPTLNAVNEVARARPELERLKKATDAVEAMLFKTLLETVQKNGGFLGGDIPGKDVYEDMVRQTLSESLASRGTLGISKTFFDRAAPQALAQARAKFLSQAKDL